MESETIRSLPIIEMSKKKKSPIKIALRVFVVALGIIGLIAALLMCISIILILPGIGLGMVSIVFIAAGFGKYYVAQCPNCKKRTPLVKDKEEFRCKKCKQEAIVNWH